MPAENVAIMLPKTMTFDGGKDFQALGGEASGPGTQTYLATNVKADVPLGFTVSGSGSMPREQQNPQGGAGQGMGQGAPGMGAGAGDQGGPGASGGQGGGQDQTPQTSGPGGGVAGAVPIGTPDPLQKYKWYLLSGVGLLLVIGAAFMLRAKPGQGSSIAVAEPSPLTPTLPPGVRATTYRAQVAAAVPAANGAAQKTEAAPGTSRPNVAVTLARGTPMLSALKEELFQLETERLEGKITDAEYAEHKGALEVMLKRALAREAAKQ
jgi:hypothetical protein